MYNEFNFIVQINSVDNKYAFVVSTNNADKPTRIVASTLSFESEYSALSCIPTAYDIYKLYEDTNRFLTIFHKDTELDIEHEFILNKKQNSDDWNGIVVRQGNDRYFKCREDAIIDFPELEPLLPETSIDKPQMVWGVVEISPNETGYYTVKEAVVYADKDVAKSKLNLYQSNFTTSKYSVFGFEVRTS